MFKKLAHLALLSPLLLKAQDTLTLDSGELLRGTVQSVSKGKKVLISHIGVKTPFVIDANKVKTIELNKQPNFNDSSSSDIPTRAGISFINGDSIIGKIQSINKTTVDFTSSNLEETFSIPRKKIHQIVFGSSVAKSVYSSDYTDTLFATSFGWKLLENYFTTSGNSQMWQQFDLTDNFVIGFKYQWTRSPQLQVHFGAMSQKPVAANPRYVINIINDLITISQNNSDGTNKFFPNSAPSFQLQTQSVSDKEAHIELWVSRSNGNIYMYLNGNLAQKIYFPMTPLGNNVGFQSSGQGAGNSHTLSNIKISTWDGRIPPKSTSSIVSSTHEKISYVNGDTFKGKLLYTKKSNNKINYYLKYEHAKDQIISPEGTLSSIYLNPLKPKEKIQLSQPTLLRDQSLLQLSGITLSNEKLRAKHPILGSVTIPKSSLNTIHFN